MKKTSKNGRTRWHRLLGRLFEELLTPAGVSVFTEFPVMAGSPEADILLLRKRQGRWTPEQAEFLPDGIRDSKASHILIEFKYTESVTEDTFRQTTGYEFFYRVSRNLKPRDVRFFVMSSKTPQGKLLKRFGYTLSEKKGVYLSDNPVLQPFPLLCLNELTDEPHNAFVKCFASRKKEKTAAFGALARAGFGTLRSQVQWLMQGLLRYWFSEKGEHMETRELTPDKVMEMGKMWADLILSGLPAEERLRGLGPEEVLSRYKPEERLRGLGPEERLRGLTEEEIKNYLLKLKKKREKKQKKS